MAGIKFFPYKNFYILSNLSPDVVQARLQHETTFKDSGASYIDKFTPPDTCFKGSVTKYKFSLTPFVNYDNLFLPKITGAIEPNGQGSKVRVKMALSSNALIIMSVGMGVVALVCLFVCYMAYRIITFKGMEHYTSNFNWATLIPFAVFIIGHIVTFAVFGSESSKAEAVLIKLFEGQKE